MSQPGLEFADSHCHLNYEGLAGRADEIVESMRAAGVTRALNICTTMEEAQTVLDQARGYEQVWASVGVHPDYDEV
ncbi:MAG: TatD family hydrolase, partial [Burkholderiaceae bacterium]